jgi:FkbH-like protein
MKSFQELKRNLKKDFGKFQYLKVAVLADSSSQLYIQSLRGYGFEVGINLDIYEADFDQIDLEVFNYSSKLYSEEQHYIIVYQSSEKLFDKYSILNYEEKVSFADDQIDYINSLCQAISERSKAKLVFFNFAECRDNVFGNFANKTKYSFVYQIRKLNYELMNLAQRSENLYINDLSALSFMYGYDFVKNTKVYFQTELIFSFDFLPVISKNTMDIILSIEGKFKKCLILDLDNTLWGGIIGDDGMEKIEIGELGLGKAFVQIQTWAKQLKERGIILAVCSKNNEEIAREPFERHPEMILHLEDIAVFVANWESKVSNIKYIQSILNIGYDSMVFLDDNPYERMIVKSSFPELTVPDLPADPTEYFTLLSKLNLFETANFVLGDARRTKQYQEEADRIHLQNSFTNEDDFLTSLNMIAEVKTFSEFTAPRIAQLSQRSNQFNFRTIRLTELDVLNFVSSKEYYTFSFSLRDKYGDHGLIGFVILQKRNNRQLFIHSWLMSCRVLNRTVENFILNTITKFGKENEYQEIIGQYIPTTKNVLVKNYFAKNGFVNESEAWYLSLINFSERKTFINLKN